ncbi:MAG: hypothetical protein FWG09_08160 [Synergistaceae bacterium]|nr:hypothetical protein [Synergistaceae bacterium]
MPTAAIEREELQEMVLNLPDEKVTDAVNFMRELCADFDPFYSESNMRHLRAVKSDALLGINMSAHDLIEAEDA